MERKKKEKLIFTFASLAFPIDSYWRKGVPKEEMESFNIWKKVK